MKDGVSEIINSTFYRNQARDGGAIYLDKPARVLVSGNNFTNNEASRIDRTWKHAHGGAIIYACQSDDDFQNKEVSCEVVLHENWF